jgi:hypothetical protein
MTERHPRPSLTRQTVTPTDFLRFFSNLFEEVRDKSPLMSNVASDTGVSFSVGDEWRRLRKEKVNYMRQSPSRPDTLVLHDACFESPTIILPSGFHKISLLDYFITSDN